MSGFYTGVGSRETPPLVLLLMHYIAKYQLKRGRGLRSGHAPGADQAFESGAGFSCQIYLPWPSFCAQLDIKGVAYDEPTEAAMRMAEKFHPAWNKLRQGARKLHARNCHQVLGYNLNEPSEMLICWTENGKTVGGTATAIRIAEKYCIPIHNLGNTETLRLWMRKVNHEF